MELSEYGSFSYQGDFYKPTPPQPRYSPAPVLKAHGYCIGDDLENAFPCSHFNAVPLLMMTNKKVPSRSWVKWLILEVGKALALGAQRENSDVQRKAFSDSVFRFVGSEVLVVCRHCASRAHRQWVPGPAHRYKGQGQPLAEIYGIIGALTRVKRKVINSSDCQKVTTAISAITTSKQ